MANFDVDLIAKAIQEQRGAYRATNPYLAASKAVAETPVITAEMEPWHRAVARTLQGFTSGVTGGYGQQQAEQYDDQLYASLLGGAGQSSPGVSAAMARGANVPGIPGGGSNKALNNAVSLANFGFQMDRAAEMDKLKAEQGYEGKFWDPYSSAPMRSTPGYTDTMRANQMAENYGRNYGTTLGANDANIDTGYAANRALAQGTREGNLAADIRLGRQANYNTNFGAESGKLSGQADVLRGPDGTPLKQDPNNMRRNPNIMDQEALLRKEFSGEQVYKDYTQMSNTFNMMLRHYYDDSGATDLAFIIGIMKMLDPTSIVSSREGDKVVSTTGFSDEVIGAYKQALEGKTRFSPAGKKSLLTLAANKHDVTKRDFDTKLENYRRAVTERGGRAENAAFFPSTSSAYKAVQSLDLPTAINDTGRILVKRNGKWEPLYGGL